MDGASLPSPGCLLGTLDFLLLICISPSPHLGDSDHI